MTNYLFRRLLAMPLLLLGVATMAFLLSNFVKGDPLASIVNERQMGNPEVVAVAKERWGLDKSIPERYVIYIGNLLQGDLGTSFRTKRPVFDDLRDRLPATIELVVCAMLFGSLTGALIGVLAAQWRNHAIDHGARFVAVDRVLRARLLVWIDRALHLFGSICLVARSRTSGSKTVPTALCHGLLYDRFRLCRTMGHLLPMRWRIWCFPRSCWAGP